MKRLFWAIGVTVLAVGAASADDARQKIMDDMYSLAGTCKKEIKCMSLIAEKELKLGTKTVKAVSIKTPNGEQIFFRGEEWSADLKGARCHCVDCVSVPPVVQCELPK
jgi:hypothetical protein